MKRKLQFKKVSIKWRIFSYFAVFTAAVLGLLWVLQVVFLDDFYKAIKIREIQTSAQTLAKNIDSADFATTMQNIVQSTQMSIVVSDENGAKLYEEVTQPNNIFQQFNSRVLTRIYAGVSAEPNQMLFERSDIGQQNGFGPDQRSRQRRLVSMLYAQIVKRANGSSVLVLLNSTISPVDATVNTLRVQLVCITMIMLVLGLVLALILAKHISRPIVKINTTAKAFGEGNYAVSFEEKGYREIAELARTLNYATTELNKTETLRRDLIANVSHDLRTPLTMITGYSEVMRDLPGENTPENVQIIIDEAIRLTTLVNDMLDISKLQSGTQPFTRTEFNLTQSIRTILLRYSKLTDYNITFEAPEDVFVNADELKISQVVYNLVNNAITYTGADKVVAIRQEVLNRKVRVEVRDTGEGIPEEKLEDIWDRYYKVDKAHKRAQIGTGLGLSIVKTILDMHGGAYGVRSQEGSGSTFWFELDIAEEKE